MDCTDDSPACSLPSDVTRSALLPALSFDKLAALSAADKTSREALEQETFWQSESNAVVEIDTRDVRSAKDTTVHKLRHKWPDWLKAAVMCGRNLSLTGELYIPVSYVLASNLEELTLTHSDIDDEDLTALIACRPSLMRLSFIECPNITELGVTMISKHNDGLQELALVGCGNILQSGQSHQSSEGYLLPPFLTSLTDVANGLPALHTCGRALIAPAHGRALLVSAHHRVLQSNQSNMTSGLNRLSGLTRLSVSLLPFESLGLLAHAPNLTVLHMEVGCSANDSSSASVSSLRCVAGLRVLKVVFSSCPRELQDIGSLSSLKQMHTCHIKIMQPHATRRRPTPTNVCVVMQQLSTVPSLASASLVGLEYIPSITMISPPPSPLTDTAMGVDRDPLPPPVPMLHTPEPRDIRHVSSPGSNSGGSASQTSHDTNPQIDGLVTPISFGRDQAVALRSCETLESVGEVLNPSCEFWSFFNARGGTTLSMLHIKLSRLDAVLSPGVLTAYPNLTHIHLCIDVHAALLIRHVVCSSSLHAFLANVATFLQALDPTKHSASVLFVANFICRVDTFTTSFDEPDVESSTKSVLTSQSSVSLVSLSEPSLTEAEVQAIHEWKEQMDAMWSHTDNLTLDVVNCSDMSGETLDEFCIA
ncbi:unnamed protein product [Vitrella brassicaformis CCMP3155]|uniref:F-box domain-containing protein n=1 Tax=Vitrella brassicaformis (strain CCMP3155) TaxID=1169540 RepID=A0A0G4G0Q3_VITBC|nr:unnamed protein product [Vitrella brassicaformis CCMP3155]|eukprot:CEM21653.1 unnamed protein product [Vitrella brassicaformis CCMP3155]